MDGQPSITECARAKWKQFIQLFLPQLQAAGFTFDELATPWETAATFITLAWLYRGSIEDKDETTLRLLVEASDRDNKVAILATWDAMKTDDKERVWRYAKWFFNVVLT